MTFKGFFKRVTLPVTLLLVSAASMALEIIAGRALAPYVGMSLYSWTVIIAVVLAGLSIGHWVGGAMIDRVKSLKKSVASTLILAAISSAASLGLLKLIEPSVTTLDPVSHVLWLALGAFFLPSMFAGIISPVLTKLALDNTEPERQGSVLGLMFALGAFGAILGTLIAGLILISWIGTTGSIILISIIYALLSLLFWETSSRLVATLAILIGSTTILSKPTIIGLENSCLKETTYFCVRVDDLVFNGRKSRVMALDHLAHGVNDAADPTLLLSPYVQGVDEIIRSRFKTQKIDAFFVGGGAYTLPRAWQRTFPKGRFVIAELDPEVSRIANDRLWFEAVEQTKILHGDARLLLGSLPNKTKFDVIFGDAFHDISIPPHLVSDEFHELVRSRLSENGVYAINVVDSFREPRFLLSLVETLQKRFTTVELWLDTQSIPAFDARVTWIAIATEKPTPTGTIASNFGLSRQWVRAPIKRMKEIVGSRNLVTLTDDYAPVDRLLAHVLLDPVFAE